MASLTGSPQIFHGDTTVADSSQQVPYGTRARDANGNEYIYLRGTASTVAGSWVTFDLNASNTALLTANAVGPVGIAGTATTTNLYGWYQIYGKNTQAATDTTATNKALYIDGTDGRADDAAVTGDLIVGAKSLAADSSNVCTVWINYPFVTDVLG